MDAPHIIPAMPLESSLRLGDHPRSASRSHFYAATSACHCVSLQAPICDLIDVGSFPELRGLPAMYFTNVNCDLKKVIITIHIYSVFILYNNILVNIFI